MVHFPDVDALSSWWTGSILDKTSAFHDTEIKSETSQMSQTDSDQPRAGSRAAGLVAHGAVFLAIALSLGTIAAFAGLVPLGQWQPDEYANFVAFRYREFGHFIDRIFSWSPRPLSEMLIYGYAAAVARTGQQLVAPFLGSLWIALLAAALLPLFRPPAGERRRSSELLLAVSLLALFLSGHRVAEVFYWTQGAAAYLPTLSAITFVTISAALGQREGSGSRLWFAAVLIIAALSSEVGAFFVASYGGAMLVLLTLSHLMWRRPSRWEFAACAIPLMTALWVIRALVAGRFGAAGEVYGDPLVAHHVLASLMATMVRLPYELLTLEGGPIRLYSVLQAILSKGAFAIGCYLVFMHLPRRATISQSLTLVSIALAAMVAIVVSLLGAYYQFGGVCCERHETFRKCLLLIVIVATTRLVSLHVPAVRLRADCSAALLAISFGASVLLANLHSYPRLLAEYQRYDVTRDAAERTWASGRAPGDTMTFFVPPFGIVNSAMTWPRGHFPQSGPDTPSSAEYSIGYFGKKSGNFVDIGSQAPAPQAR